MIIKTRPRWWKKLRTLKPRTGEKHQRSMHRYLLLLFFALLTASLLVNFFALNELSFMTELYQEELKTPKAATKVSGKDQEKRLPAKIISADELPLINLDIKFKHFKKLRKERQEALARGILIVDDDSFVPATIRYGDKHLKTKLRLKGDWLDHLKSETKWSFRVHTRKGATLFGMRRFSLQSPKTRAYQKEPLFIELARDIGGLIAPRYNFVRLFVNGDDWGVMALEEGFSSELLEYHQRKASVIIRYDESDTWSAISTDNLTMSGNLLGDYQGAVVDSFSSSKVAADPILSKYQTIALGLLRGFSDRKLSAAQVFDLDRTGYYLALCHLFGNWHGLVWHNMRFYYNPISGRLEPIVFDASQIDSQSKFLKSKIVNQMLEDRDLRERYQAAVAELGASLETEELTLRIKTLDEKWRGYLIEEFGDLAPINTSQIMRHYQQIIAQDFPAPNTNIDKMVGAWVVGRNDGLLLEVRNLTPVPVTMTALKVNGIPVRGQTERLPLYLYPRSIYYPGKSEFFRLQLPTGTPATQISVEATFEGAGRTASHQAIDYRPPRVTDVLPAQMSVDSLMQLNPFLQYDFTRNCLTPDEGSWHVAGSLIPPLGVGLCIDPNTTLRFSSEAFVLLREAPLTVAGKPGQPSAFTAEQEYWGGIAVMDSPAPSVINHLHVSNTTGVAQKDWNLTGGTTFYKSDVTIENSSFISHRGEDALNVVHADVRMNNTLFRDTLSDAFDGDFITGAINNVTFRDIGLAGGGDGLDVSGSQIEVNNCTFIDVSDKGLSVGESSQVVARNCRAERCGVGAAAKDGSTLKLDNFSVYQGRLAGVMAYIKKSEYGPASISASGLKVDTTTPEVALAQKKSRVSIDGQKVATQKIDVENLYDTVMKPGVKKQ